MLSNLDAALLIIADNKLPHPDSKVSDIKFRVSKQFYTLVSRFYTLSLFMVYCLSFKSVYNLLHPKHFFLFLAFQADSLIIQHCPELFSSIDDEVCILQEEIASLEKVTVTLESEMQDAMKTDGQYPN